MADLAKKRPENVEGNFFVDSTCIDCGLCYWMAPSVFKEIGDQSAVFQQPSTHEETLAASRTLVSCPTSSIGTLQTPPEVKEAIQGFPLEITKGVFHCGYHSKKSYGAASYFIQRPTGNVLVDSPRFATPLVRALEKLGGIRYLFLTHRDDVADHARFREHFQCERILHVADSTAVPGKMERVLNGENAVAIEEDLLAIPVPGHTEGHMVLLYRNEFLFTGDHLAYSVDQRNLTAFRDACWYSWSEQIRSMRKLTAYDFEWVLPGHGRRHHADKPEMKAQIERCVKWMESIK